MIAKEMKPQQTRVRCGNSSDEARPEDWTEERAEKSEARKAC